MGSYDLRPSEQGKEVEMNKAEFVNQLALKSGLSKKQAQSALETALNLIVETNRGRKKVTFSGFGTFEVRQVKSMQRYNPRTGQRFTVPAKAMPKFRASKTFKDSVND